MFNRFFLSDILNPQVQYIDELYCGVFSSDILVHFTFVGYVQRTVNRDCVVQLSTSAFVCVWTVKLHINAFKGRSF